MNKIRTRVEKSIRWIMLLLSIIILIYIIKNLLQKDITNFDNAVYYFVASFISEPLTDIALVITTLGSVYVILPICLIIIIVFWKKIEGISVAINLIISFLANQILKRIVARPRPTEYRIIEELGYSFPSGHSMVSMAFYGLLIYFIYRKVKNPYIKWISCTLLTILIFLIGLSRIYLGVHYASDVLAGFCISAAYLALFTQVIAHKIK